MRGYMLTVVLLRFGVVFLLLMGVNRICFGASGIGRCLLASGVGGIYTWACMLPGLDFLGNIYWYIVFLVMISMVCFGWEKSSIRPAALFVLFDLVLDSIVSDRTQWWTGLLGIAALLILCFYGFGGGGLVPVELKHDGKCVCFMALRDTGNSLKDPVTGRPVLVVGAQVAGKLTGLTREQLQKPVESIGLLPGLRLIPYNTVGRSGALMLAMRLRDIKIGSWKGSGLVAFAPETLGRYGTYQALTGGAL